MIHMSIRHYPSLAGLFNLHFPLFRNGVVMLFATLVLTLAGCGGDHRSAALYTLSGQVTGLADGQQVTLLNNGGDALTVTNGTFVFATPLVYGASYNVTVSASPTGQTCSVANNSGAGSGVTSDVASVQIVCSTYAYNIGGSLSGLQSGQQVTLLNNGSDALTVTANGTFNFANPVAYGASYNVTVSTQPIGFRWCSTTNGTGTVQTNVSNVTFNCEDAIGSVTTLPNNIRMRVRDLTYDGRGNLYGIGYFSGKIYKIDLLGNVTELVISSALHYALVITIDDRDNLYVINDNNDPVILKIDPSGNVTTIAGSGATGSADGQGTAASFNQPAGITYDKLGNLYVTESEGNKIRKIDSSGNVTTIAGSGAQGNADGQGTAASFDAPVGIVSDGHGTLYVVDNGNNKIRKIDPSGNVTTIAGSGAAGSADGQGTAASFNGPIGIASDGRGTLYVTDARNNKIRKIDPSGNVTTIAGSGARGNADGQGTAASFDGPIGIASDDRGTVYVADASFGALSPASIRKIVPAGRTP